MRRTAALVAAMLALACLALGRPGGAEAHPLGNFTVNHYAGIELAGDRVFVRFVLDLAEIPTFQVGNRVRAQGYGAAVARELELRLDGHRVPLAPLADRVVSSKGAGGLPTLRFEAIYAAALRGTALTFADRTFPSRIGWREITVSARDGARVVDATVSARSRSDELRAYPQELLSSPLALRTARATVVAGDGRGAQPALGESAAPTHRGGGFEALVDRGELSVGVVVLSLLVAAFWGAAHALTPGHGKALVAAYLIGTRGRPRDAVLLGATVTVTHTAGVFGLGLVTLLLSRFIVPEQLYPWLTLVSGLLVVGVGLAVLRSRVRTGVRPRSDTSGHGHHHTVVRPRSDTSGDGHHHTGVRLQSDTSGHHHHQRRGIVGVGVAAGLLPCPSALVVLLSAIALHRIGFGLALIVSFSLGLAATITVIGLLAVLARRAFSRISLDGPLVRALPSLSALAILVAGVAITVRAIPGVV